MVKLDVDGYECDVLSGASKMMRRDKPTFVMELTPYILQERGHSAEKMISFFTPLGYRFFHEKTGKELPIDAPSLAGMVGDGASVNVIARVG